MPENLLEKVNKNVKKSYSDVNWKGSFFDYISEKLKKEPHQAIRTSLQFLNDAVEFFGKTKIEDCGETLTRYGVFEKNSVRGKGALFGIDRTLMHLCNYINTLSNEGGEERIIMLNGPPATGKSSIVNLLIKGMEEYSKTDEGQLFAFEWLFVEDLGIGDVGYNLSLKKDDKLETYAHLNEKDIAVRIQCQLRDNPLLLIPKEDRSGYLEEILKDKNIKVPMKILEGQLCLNCQSIYSTLLDKYKGNFYKLLKHIRVKRFLISELNQTGAATVISANPEGNAPMVIWGEGKELSKLGELFRGLRVHTYDGEWAYANRGLIHYQDIFDNRDERSLKALKDAVEEHLVNFNGVLGFIDAIIFGSTNLTPYKEFNDNPNNMGLRRRIRTVNVTYLLQAKEEAKIYEQELVKAGYKQIKKNPDEKHIAPHTLELAALWAVMTRYIQPDSNYYYRSELNLDDATKEVIAKLNPLLKARLYDGELDKIKNDTKPKTTTQSYDRYNVDYSKITSLKLEEKASLSRKHIKRLIRNEHSKGDFEKIEGMDGVSPSVIQDLFTEAIGHADMLRLKGEDPNEKCISPHHVINGIENILEKGPTTYSFLKKPKGNLGYNDFDRMLDYINEEFENLVAKEVEWSIINIDPSVLENKIKNYVDHVKAYVNKGTIKNPITLNDEQPSEDKMREIENILNVEDHNRERHRKGVIIKLAKFVIDESSALAEGKLDMKVIFSNIYDTLQHHLFEEKKKIMSYGLTQLKSYVERYGTKKFLELDEKNQEDVTGIIKNMVSSYGYCEDCARDTIAYAIDNKIIE